MSRERKLPWKNCIVGEGEEAPDQLLANPWQWKIHPRSQQEAIEGVLSQVGWVQRVIVNQRTQHLLDGHARVAIAISRNEPTVPVIYVDVSEDDEKLILASIDPLSAMAATDKQQLDALLREVSSEDAAVQAMLGKLAADEGLYKFDPNAEWEGMPEFEQEDQLGDSKHQLIVHFANLQDRSAFAELVGQSLTEKTRYIWYPEQKPRDLQAYRCADES